MTIFHQRSGPSRAVFSPCPRALVEEARAASDRRHMTRAAPKGKKPGPGLFTAPSFRRKAKTQVTREKQSQKRLQQRVMRFILSSPPSLPSSLFARNPPHQQISPLGCPLPAQRE